MVFPNDWSYYKEYAQPGTADGEQTNYQVEITVTHVSGKMRSDFGDIRFTDDEGTELYYHLVSYTASTTALFVVKIPTLPTTGAVIRCYYGNSSATTTSDPENVYDAYISGESDESGDFTLVDIFNSGINASLTYDSTNHYYKLKNTGEDNVFAKINALDEKANLKLKADIYRVTSRTYDQGGLVGRQKAAKQYIVGRYYKASSTYRLDLSQDLPGGETVIDSDSYTIAQNTWYTLELEIVGTTATLKWYNSSGTLLNTETSTIDGSIDQGSWGIYGAWTINSERYFKNIIARKTTANPPVVGTWGEEVGVNLPLPLGIATFTGLPLLEEVLDIPVGISTFTGLLLYESDDIPPARASFTGLPLEKVFEYTPSFFIQDENGIILKELSFESLFPGSKSRIQKLTAVNNLGSEMQMTLAPGESFNQLGSDLDTYLSHYLSSDGLNFSNNPLELTIPPDSELDFYTYWQPPSTAKIGWKQWLLDLGLEGVPSLEGWGYVSWFTVTGTGDAIEIPYTLDAPVRIDFVYGLMQYDFKDIRFALEDHTVLKYDLITKNDGDHAYFVVQLPEIPASPGEVMVYVYCGNLDAEDESDSSIHQLHNTFQGTSLDPDVWENDVPGTIGAVDYNVNNNVVIYDCDRGGSTLFPINGQPTETGCQLQQRVWKIKNQVNIEWKEKINHYNFCRGQGGIGLLRDNNTIIIWVGIEDANFTGAEDRIIFYNTEGNWSNILGGWDSSTPGKVHKVESGLKIFNLVKDGNNISIYVDDNKIADTVITSTINKLGVVVGGVTGDFSGFDNIQFDYLCEDEFVGQTLPIPIIGDVEPVWVNIYPLPIQADVLYKSVDLPELDIERRYGVRIGGTLFE